MGDRDRQMDTGCLGWMNGQRYKLQIGWIDKNLIMKKLMKLIS